MAAVGMHVESSNHLGYCTDGGPGRCRGWPGPNGCTAQSIEDGTFRLPACTDMGGGSSANWLGPTLTCSLNMV